MPRRFPVSKEQRERVTCDSCGYTASEDSFEAKVRQGNAISPRYPELGFVNVVDVGMKCPKCNTEFGFEVFKD